MRPSRLAAPTLLLGLLFFAACGGDDFTSTGGEGGAGAATSGPSSGGGDPGSSNGASGPGAGGATGTCPSGGDVCLEKPPSDWSGPVIMLGGDVMTEACSGDWDNEEATAWMGPVSAPHTCSACQCGAPDNAGCAVPTVTIHSMLNCAGSTTQFKPNANGSCTSVPTGGPSATVGPVPVIAGECGASVPVADKTEPMWSGRAALCGGPKPDGVDACTGGVCLPKPGGRDPSICVYKEGLADSCPSGYPELTVLYQALTDTRGCEACTCGPEQGASCHGAVHGWNITACSQGNGMEFSADGMCNSFAGGVWSEVQWLPEPRIAGECEPAGGAPKGNVMPGDEVTVCCTGPL